MERRQLKRIMIIILATLNGFLALYLVRQRVSEHSAAYRAEQELLALFAADGVALAPETIPRGQPPPVMYLSLDEETRTRFAALLLGPDAVHTRLGSVQLYQNGSGEVRIHPDGTFSASGLALETDPETFCREFCRAWPYVPPLSVDSDNITLGARYGGLPVCNAEAYFSFENGVLREASGTLIPPNGVTGDTPSLSAIGALSIFQAMRRENRVVSAEIRRVSLCYGFQTADGETLSLVPAWRLETDTIPYYVDCVSGALFFS